MMRTWTRTTIDIPSGTWIVKFPLGWIRSVDVRVTQGSVDLLRRSGVSEIDEQVPLPFRRDECVLLEQKGNEQLVRLLGSSQKVGNKVTFMDLIGISVVDENNSPIWPVSDSRQHSSSASTSRWSIAADQAEESDDSMKDRVPQGYHWAIFEYAKSVQFKVLDGMKGVALVGNREEITLNPGPYVKVPLDKRADGTSVVLLEFESEARIQRRFKCPRLIGFEAL